MHTQSNDGQTTLLMSAETPSTFDHLLQALNKIVSFVCYKHIFLKTSKMRGDILPCKFGQGQPRVTIWPYDRDNL